VARFTLAVNELATNAIQHGDGTAEVTVRAAQGHVIVDVEDSGPGISPGRPTDRPGPEAMRGRGLWLAREFSDRLDIITDRAGTRVRVKIAIPPA
jgi:serine/threonine-protein kinase RsbW